MLSASADDKWQPVPSWPFIYSDFQSAVIKTVKGTTVNAKANIHIGHHYLWYESKGKNLEAKKGTVKEVIFPNGKHHIAVGDKICLVIKEDTTVKVKRIEVQIGKTYTVKVDDTKGNKGYTSAGLIKYIIITANT